MVWDDLQRSLYSRSSQTTIEDIHDIQQFSAVAIHQYLSFVPSPRYSNLLVKNRAIFHTNPAFNFRYFCYGDFHISSEKTVRRRVFIIGLAVWTILTFDGQTDRQTRYVHFFR